MSKWISESTGLESKEQLKAHRRHQLQDKLADVNLDLKMYPFWLQADKDLEATLWRQADADYESRKVTLTAQIDGLPVNDKTAYFNEIGVTEVTTAIYLPASPAL